MFTDHGQQLSPHTWLFQSCGSFAFTLYSLGRVAADDPVLGTGFLLPRGSDSGLVNRDKCRGSKSQYSDGPAAIGSDQSILDLDICVVTAADLDSRPLDINQSAINC